ncbi:hypothetical protein D3C72_1171770 [compost metagenome]
MSRLEFSKLLAFTVMGSVFSLEAMAASAQSFYDYTPSPATINGERFPRNNQTLFRGTTDHQMDLKKAISAMLGDSNANVESLFFSTIKNELMDVSFPPAVGLNSYLHSQIQKLIQQNGGPLKLSAAVAATKKLVDGTFAFYDQNGSAVSNNVNYRSGSYVDWPNDIVFTTLLSPVGGTYGDRMLVVNEQKPRSLDLNFWNYVHNNTWYDHTRDIGEFVAFAYLPAADLTGYQVRDGGNKGWHYIQFAVYRSTNKKVPALLVFSGERKDGSTSTCIDFDASEKTYNHCEYRAGEIVDSKPKLSREKVSLVGIISLCSGDDDSSCARPSDEELGKYPRKSSSDASRSIQEVIKGLKVQGQRVRLISK